MNYSLMAKRFQKLIKRYDQRESIQLKIRQNGTVNGTTGLFEVGTVTTSDLSGVVVNYTDQQIDGEMIKRGDISLIIDNVVKPNVGDYVILDSEEWTVLSPIITYNPGGVVLGYTIQLRR